MLSVFDMVDKIMSCGASGKSILITSYTFYCRDWGESLRIKGIKESRIRLKRLLQSKYGGGGGYECMSTWNEMSEMLAFNLL